MTAIMEVFDEVEKRASEADWEGCFEACNKAISQCPPEQRPVAQKCQLFCLLKQGNFQQALDLLKQISADNLTFERAYALYGLKRYKEAIKCCGDSFRDRLLKAQCYYQLEEYSSSLKVYESVLDEKEFEKYTGINLMAAESCLLFQDENYKPRHPKTIDNDDSDLLYNYGCLQLIHQNLEEAERLFRACEEKMTQEGDADAINARLQLAATLQMSGRLTEAKTLYKSVLESCSDLKQPTTLATLNCLLLNDEKVPIEQMRKRLKKLSDKLAEANNMQKMCLLYNERLLSIEAGQCSDARPFKAAKNSKLWEPCNYMYLTWLMKQKKYPEALQLLKNDNSEGDAVLKAKILAAQGSFLQAAEILEGTGNSRWAPIICDLYSKANDGARLKKYVTELFGAQSSHAKAQISRGIMRLPAVKKDNELLRLVQSSIVQLPDLDSLFGEMTVDDVERSLQSADSLERKRHKSMAAADKVKRRKKNKPPKSLDKPIDPERWLPLKERSYYRHARRRGVKHTGKKTIQGGAETTESEQWLGEKTPAASSKQEAAAATPPKKPAGLQGKGMRSKRKKRDKW